MIPITQDIVGPRGNCFSACLASLFEIPLEGVPRFLSEPGDRSRFEWAARLDDWLSQFGLYALHFYAADGEPPVMPGVFYIMTGFSPRGRPHAVVGLGHEIAHDPYPGSALNADTRSQALHPPLDPSASGLSEVDGFIVLTNRFDRAQRRAQLGEFVKSAEHVLEGVEAFRKSLSPRDLMLVQIGLHASHMEEAVVSGDELRAKAHLRALAALIGQV